MMINRLHSQLFRPEKGWDPVPEGYAREYAAYEWDHFDGEEVNQIERWLGGFEGKRVLDLGGGPGQYSIEFARRGAWVTWHDISNNYLRIASRMAVRMGVEVTFSLGYLEDAWKFRTHPFDFVFNRLCWYYCFNDRTFAEILYDLVAPGGAGYIDCNVSLQDGKRGIRKWIAWVNEALNLKIGHPFPPHKRIASLLHAFPVDFMAFDYRSHINDRIFFIKSR